MIICEVFHGKISLNSVLLLLLVSFVNGFSLEFMYISLIKSIGSSLTHPHGVSYLCCCPSLKSSESKKKFRQASNHCKRVLEAAKLVYANKTKESIISQTLSSWDFCRIVFSIKVNLLYLLYSAIWRFCLLSLIKKNFLLKTFPRTPILMTQVSLYLFSLLELI